MSRAGACLECENGECGSGDMVLPSYSDTALMVEEGTGVKCAEGGMVIKNYDDTTREPADVKRDQSKIVETSTVKNSQLDNVRVIDDRHHNLYQQNSEINERIINHASTLGKDLSISLLSGCIILKFI